MIYFVIRCYATLSLLLFLEAQLTLIPGCGSINDGDAKQQPRPVPVGKTEYRVGEAAFEERTSSSSSRRMLGPFQLCLACKCCINRSDPNTCATMPCCFGIDCQLPNKPFGVCAFVPKTCSCTSCSI